MRTRLAILVLPVLLLAALVVAQPAAAAFGFVTKWGSNGTGNGQFKSPDDVATDALGSVYTIELSGNRVQKFATNGAFIWKSGTVGSGNGQFSVPAEVATDAGGRVWIAEQGNGGRVQALSQANGAYVTKWDGTGTPGGSFSSPSGIAVDNSGNVIVADAFGSVRKFTPAGAQLATYGSSGGGPNQYSLPTGVATDSANNVYVVDRGHGRVLKFGPGGGLTPIGQFGGPGTANGKLSDPTGIAIAPTGTIYVADRGNNRIQAFNANGAFIGKFGAPGTGNSQFSSPQGVAVDRSCNVFVADTGNNRIQKFGESGGGCGGNPVPDDKLLVCVGLWTSTCAGFPQPDPIQTCVSLWQDCTGFGGMPPGGPGTIDMSGLPATITTTVGCDSSASNPYASRVRSSQDNRGDGFTIQDDLKCALETYLESTDPNAVKEAKSRVEYELNARHFKTEVGAARTRVLNGLRAICQTKPSEDKQTCAVKNSLELLISDSLDEYFDYAEKPGQGVKKFGLDSAGIANLCAKFEKPPLCQKAFTSLVAAVNVELQALSNRKHRLGLHKHYGARGSAVASGSGVELAAKRKGKGKGKRRATRVKRVVLIAGGTTVAQGKRGKLRLKVPKTTRKMLRRAKRKGVRSIRAIVIVRGSLVPGVTRTKRTKVRILLVKPKKAGKRRGGAKQKRGAKRRGR